jgi:hypothetical protein
VNTKAAAVSEPSAQPETTTRYARLSQENGSRWTYYKLIDVSSGEKVTADTRLYEARDGVGFRDLKPGAYLGYEIGANGVTRWWKETEPAEQPQAGKPAAEMPKARKKRA